MSRKSLGAVFGAWLCWSGLAHAAEPKPYLFFPFCIDWHDAKKRSFEERAVMLKELGYEGLIGLQCFGIAGDAREHLARSIAAWKKN